MIYNNCGYEFGMEECLTLSGFTGGTRMGDLYAQRTDEAGH